MSLASALAFFGKSAKWRCAEVGDGGGGRGTIEDDALSPQQIHTVNQYKIVHIHIRGSFSPERILPLSPCALAGDILAEGSKGERYPFPF